METRRVWCVGLTGGIASGKSTVAQIFKSHGVTVIDTDEVNASLIAPGGLAIPELTQAFGAAILNAEGGLDRARMRELAFRDPTMRQRLEAILHPMIRRSVESQVAQTSGPYAMLVIPLLFETDFFADRLNRVLVVDTDESLQRTRALQRPGVTETQLEAILSVQCARDQRLERADDVIRNTGDLAQLDRAVDALHQKYAALALGCAT